MKKVRVRCWEFAVPKSQECEATTVYVTYPEGNSGHELITCLRCGEIYAVDIAKEVYLGPRLKEKLRDTLCRKCSSVLGDSYGKYPDEYFCNGGIGMFRKPIEIPNDSESIVREFFAIYG